VYHPFEARHLDWYPSDAAPGYHRSSSPAIARWNKAAQLAVFGREELRFERYNVVETAGDGRLIVRSRAIAGSPP
jgi:hypothetical protein